MTNNKFETKNIKIGELKDSHFFSNIFDEVVSKINVLESKNSFKKNKLKKK